MRQLRCTEAEEEEVKFLCILVRSDAKRLRPDRRRLIAPMALICANRVRVRHRVLCVVFGVSACVCICMFVYIYVCARVIKNMGDVGDAWVMFGITVCVCVCVCVCVWLCAMVVR